MRCRRSACQRGGRPIIGRRRRAGKKSPSLTTYHDIAMNRSPIQIATESRILRHAAIGGNFKQAIHLQQKQRNTSPLPQVSASNGEEFAPLAAAPIDVKHGTSMNFGRRAWQAIAE